MIFDAPHAIREARLHGRRDAQRPVDADEIVVHVVELHGRRVVSRFLLKPFVRRVNRRIDIAP